MQPVFEWLVSRAAAQLETPALLEGLAERIQDSGVPLLRMSTFVRTKHPEVVGEQVVWLRGKGARIIARSYASTSTAYGNTPAETITRTRKPVRCRLDVPREALAYPVLSEIAAEGGTDYYALALSDGESFLGLATDRAGGFREEDIAGLDRLVGPLSLHCQLAGARLATRSLLTVYLGSNAARHVLNGAFHRGTGTPIPAAIWFCDMRGFTVLGDSLPAQELVGVLDRYFEAVAGPIESQGGEILKLIGDAALAVFPIEGAAPADACRRALAAAEGVLADVAALPPVRSTQVGIGVAMHLGEVMYGNIGGHRRLDFTVIGAAVNEVCRVEGLCKQVGASLLMTASFADALGREGLVSLGTHALKGVSEPREVFTIGPRAQA
jgi:adenylate cyclase